MGHDALNAVVRECYLWEALAAGAGVETDFNVSQLRVISTEICASQRVSRIQSESGFCTNRAELRSSSVRICPKHLRA
ncbi:MAG: hypothetical protein DME66_00385 [Verrucomicrobia bacterium]|nr:MAG: hypothetical protein DME66_00385 [Verrucomicrobiota bacterium]